MFRDREYYQALFSFVKGALKRTLHYFHPDLERIKSTVTALWAIIFVPTKSTRNEQEADKYGVKLYCKLLYVSSL